MKQLLVLLFFLCSASVSAQDVIVKKDGSTVLCRIVELTESEIVYKKWNDLKGSSYVMERSAASAINYQNGKKVNLSKATNLYKPNNQNDGVQRTNDRALLAMDFKAQQPEENIRKLRKWGWISCAIGGVGVVTAIVGQFAMDTTKAKNIFLIAGGGCAVAGFTAAICCFSSAKKRQKQLDDLVQSYPIIQKEFFINNGSSLSAGIDMVNNQAIGNRTLGLGLRYNF